MTHPDVPVEQAAALARRMAPELCRKDPESGEDCSWYHGLWLDLRAAGLAATAQYQAGFFLDAFGRMQSLGRPMRLLISGSADYSILAQILWACQARGVEAAATVLDRCETPLFINRWYAGQVGCRIETARADVTDYSPDVLFDVVCGHGFLGQVPPEARAMVVASWTRLLAPGGAILAINRVRPPGCAPVIRFGDAEGAEFCRLAQQRFRERRLVPESELDGVIERTRLYVRRLQGYAITEAEFEQPFRDAGLRIEIAAAVTSGDARNSGLTGPAIPAESRHLCVMARNTAGAD